MPLQQGAHLGPYEVLSPLGSGGMGEVYRGRDPRLGREVAIKVLPERVAEDREALSRFEREARAVASLSHPNILAIHDFGVEGRIAYSVTELLEGETLRERMGGERLPARKALEYATQIARGLAAAHDKGIVHRDLKPENVFVGEDGHVKILDFGLARMTSATPGDQSASPTVDEATRPGTVMGTMGYMSPEQLRGLPVDHRSDIFSFGAILYEMLCGKAAFRRDTAADTVSAILREDPPPPAATAQEVGPGLQRLVHRCLEKNAAERFQSARDLAFHIEDVSGASSVASGPFPVAGPAPGGRSGLLTTVFAGGLIAGVALGALVTIWLRPIPSAAPPTFRYLSYTGGDMEPSASPDGRLIAYTSIRDGRSQIWLKQFPGGDEVSLTTGPDDSAPRVSPDGAQVLFTRGDTGGDALYKVPLVGGEPRKIIDNASSGDWSPDGREVTFLRTDAGEDGRFLGIMGIVEASGQQSRELIRLDRATLNHARWSPDGRTIAVVATGSENSPYSLLLVNAADGTLETLEPPPPRGRLSSPAWVGGGDAILYAQAESVVQAGADSGTGRLLLQKRDSDRAEVKMWLPSMAETLDVLGEGTVLLGVRNQRQNLSERTLEPGRAGEGARPITRGSSADRQPAYSPDGEWILFSSTRSGNLDLWKISTTTRAIHRITDDAADDWDPAFTPDGRSILWSSNRSGHFEIWICTADGTGARQLTRDGFDAENPTATRDGRWVVYNSSNPDHSGIWKIHPDGSGGERLVPGSWSTPDVSPDGRYVAFRTSGVQRWVQVARVEDGRLLGEPLEAPGIDTNGRPRWTPDGGSLVYTAADAGGVRGLLIRDFIPGRGLGQTARPLLPFQAGETIESFSLSPDGTRLAYSVMESIESLMLAQGLPGVSRARPTGR